MIVKEETNGAQQTEIVMKTNLVWHAIALLLLSVYCTSCAPSRFVKPLAKGEQAINVAVGGPVITYSNLPVPLPLLSATYGYGIDSSLTFLAVSILLPHSMAMHR